MSRDLRKYAKGTNRGLIIGFFVLLFGVGITLVWAIYGSAAAVSGLLCMLAGTAPIALIWFVLNLISWIVSRSTDEETTDSIP